MAKTVLITGGSRGIGRATAIDFARAGYQVVVNYQHSQQAAQQLVSQLVNEGCLALAVQADVADEAQVQQMIEKVQQVYGGVDILINNAGIAQQQLFTDITSEQWQRMFAVHVNGAFYCTQGVLPHMLRQKWGRIVNISSIWGLVGASCEVHYSAAKAALIGMTKALAKELGPSHILVNCVAPGVIETDMNSSLDQETMDWLSEETPLGIIGQPQDIAQSIMFLAGETNRFITGQVVSPNGGFVIN